MKNILRGAMLSIAASTLAMGTAHAGDFDNVIKHRHANMEAMGGHLSAIFSTLGGPAEVQDFKFHADAIVRLGELSEGLFPVGSGDGKTEASEDIWKKPDDFKAAMDTFMERSKTLASVADSGDIGAIVGAAKKLGGSCKGCHDDFKED